MMTNVAIRVENLSKRYRIGLKEERRNTLVGAFTNLVRQPVKNLRRLRRLTTFTNDGQEAPDIVWALKDISLEVQHGEVVGIIGHNGAGKSTLLKILSQITRPTSGRVEIYGRVSSLLEVGTGFHPELTGRENVYLNGAILGMKKAEIDHKFDEIVAFAEVDKFIDTPVKHYSSGMYVRLAFSVAAHLEPEILLVDEVLAVGDVFFQKKCLGKMGTVAKEGRTVLFVSHNIVAIQALCSRSIWIDNGQKRIDGKSPRVVGAYISDSTTNSLRQSIESLPRICGGTEVRLVGVELRSDELYPVDTFEYGKGFNMRFTIRVNNNHRRFFAIEWLIRTVTGERVLYGSSSPQQTVLISPTEELVRVECKVPFLPLASGSYWLDCLLSVPHQERLDEVEGVARFEVVRCDPWNTGFNLINTIALTTTANQWRIVSGGKEVLPSPEHVD